MHSHPPPPLPTTTQVWDHNPDMLFNKGVAEASYVLVGATAVVSLAAGAITLEALPAKEEAAAGKKK
jgi:hypothetical protein